MYKQCPICFNKIPKFLLEEHVNFCLDSQEKPLHIVSVDSGNNKNVLSDREDYVKKNNKKRSKSSDVFSALGLRKQPSGKSIKTEKRATSDGQFKNDAHEVSGDANTRAQRVDKNEDIEFPKKNYREIADLSLKEKRTSFKGEFNTDEAFQLKNGAKLPLAHRLRPLSLDEFYGQSDLVGEDGILRNMIKEDSIFSFILWGPPGIGKTTLAKIIASSTRSRFVEISGVDGTTSRLKDLLVSGENEKRLTGRNTILFIDEIHRFNKAIQDVLLPAIEKGTITVIGATTENPSFTINNALLSRLHTFVMHKLSQEEIVKIINKGLLLLNKTRKCVYGLHLIALDKEAINYIAKLSSGDSRTALNILESLSAYLSNAGYAISNVSETTEQTQNKKLGVVKVGKDNLKIFLGTRRYQQMYDKQGDSHYDTISAFHKSVRGSDANAAVFYLVKMLSGGEDPMFIARRMLVIASEDIGLRDSFCLPFAVAAKEAVDFIGMPEAEIVLAHCATKLAQAPKSTKSYRALRSVQSYFRENPDTTNVSIPLHLRNAPTKLMKQLNYGRSYKYNPHFENGVVSQQYMPESLPNINFLDDKHLGSQQDDDVHPISYAHAQKAEDDYLKFKKFKTCLRKKYIKELINYNKQRRDNSVSCNSLRNHLYHKVHSKNLTEDDGNGSDLGSDVSQGRNNFDQSFDEFLREEDQPQYFKNSSDLEPYDPDNAMYYYAD